MDPATLERFREQLLRLRHHLAGDAAAHAREGFDLGTDGTQDAGDAAATSSARQLLLGRSERERATLRAIDAALDRIDAGSYGECALCGDAIAVARLEIVPHTVVCVECKADQETEGR